MADLTPDDLERLRLVEVAHDEYEPVYRLDDPAVLAALLQRHDEAVRLLRQNHADLMEQLGVKPGTGEMYATCAFLAALDREGT